jgi:hypothetical protein
MLSYILLTLVKLFIILYSASLCIYPLPKIKGISDLGGISQFGRMRIAGWYYIADSQRNEYFLSLSLEHICRLGKNLCIIIFRTLISTSSCCQCPTVGVNFRTAKTSIGNISACSLTSSKISATKYYSDTFI